MLFHCDYTRDQTHLGSRSRNWWDSCSRNRHGSNSRRSHRYSCCCRYDRWGSRHFVNLISSRAIFDSSANGVHVEKVVLDDWLYDCFALIAGRFLIGRKEEESTSRFGFFSAAEEPWCPHTSFISSASSMTLSARQCSLCFYVCSEVGAVL